MGKTVLQGGGPLSKYSFVKELSMEISVKDFATIYYLRKAGLRYSLSEKKGRGAIVSASFSMRR